jgi:hypothetical protein
VAGSLNKRAAGQRCVASRQSSCCYWLPHPYISHTTANKRARQAGASAGCSLNAQVRERTTGSQTHPPCLAFHGRANGSRLLRQAPLPGRGESLQYGLLERRNSPNFSGTSRRGGSPDNSRRRVKLLISVQDIRCPTPWTCHTPPLVRALGAQHVPTDRVETMPAP